MHSASAGAISASGSPPGARTCWNGSRAWAPWPKRARRCWPSGRDPRPEFNRNHEELTSFFDHMHREHPQADRQMGEGPVAVPVRPCSGAHLLRQVRQGNASVTFLGDRTWTIGTGHLDQRGGAFAPGLLKGAQEVGVGLCAAHRVLPDDHEERHAAQTDPSTFRTVRARTASPNASPAHKAATSCAGRPTFSPKRCSVAWSERSAPSRSSP